MPLPASQQFVQVETIKDGVVVLKSGDLRAVLIVSAMNFALKSGDEQEAIVFAFQNFLNSLDFDLQIFLHSRRVNIGKYLAVLENLKEGQENELLRTQTAEYIEFIRGFVEDVNVMAKSFYVVVPFSTKAAHAKENPFAGLAGLLPLKAARATVEIEPEKFRYYRTELSQRVEFVLQGLHSVGLRATMLSTGELIELFWGLYNPDKAETEEAPEIGMESAFV